ncbi:MAG: hypothetical protein JSV90_07080 [Methanobacteriota archaeon]|nr:MAG: hypothetical protein JSV90_07080 [Euryarchaeota archaeon]
MDRKIIGIMLALVVVAIVVVGVVAVATVGMKKSGGFSKLFDDLEYSGDLTYRQELEIPDDWNPGDVKRVSDTIVDMHYYVHSVPMTVYVTTLYFVYLGEEWNSPAEGTRFYVPVEWSLGELDWIQVNHGVFSIQVSSATNLSAAYDVGDVIKLQTTIVDAAGTLAFGEWQIADTL